MTHLTMQLAHYADSLSTGMVIQRLLHLTTVTQVPILITHLQNTQLIERAHQISRQMYNTLFKYLNRPKNKITLQMLNTLPR